jgi:hypothetical protein
MPLFDYPAVQLVRIHGPLGYNDYSSYRAWLRDEFAFRCVYCFSREQWGRVTPIDLPNLARLRPPGGNSRPAGVDASHFARRARGELPAIC